MSVAETIRHKLTERFAPTRLTVVDESHRHAGHAGQRPCRLLHQLGNACQADPVRIGCHEPIAGKGNVQVAGGLLHNRPGDADAET